ncbi:MAG: SBBP repeat-containing protein, partial [Terriglobales bacterium]
MSMCKLSRPRSRFASTLTLTGVAVLFSAAAVLAQAPKAQRMVKAQYAQLPMTFEANQGQTNAQAQFLARSRGTIVFLTQHGMIVKTSQGAVGMTFTGARAAARARGLDAMPSPVHYFTGTRDLAVKSYRKVRYADMYPGVGTTYYGHDGQVEFDLDLAPHTSPAAVRMAFRGAVPRLGADGSLILAHGITLRSPRAYQTANGHRHTVAVHYALLADHQVGLSVGAHDANRALVVDPILSFATLLGGTAYNQANAVAVDANGNGYVAGYTLSTDFPTQAAFQASIAAGQFGPAPDAFVSEISADGTKLIYSTYLGGNGDDEATGIAVDLTGNAYVTGYTNSTNFPTKGPIQSANNGFYDAFVTKINAGGASLAYSTYLGGSQDDKAAAIAVDPQGEAFITGTTSSSDFSVSATAPQKTLGGKTDAFVVGINAAGSATLYATYLGGADVDNGKTIAVDQTGNAYVGGSTASSNFPVTAGAYQSASGGGIDGFVAQIPRAGTSIGWATYLGGSAADEINALTLDSAGSVYVAGDTTSSNLFCPVSSCQSSYAGQGDAFVAKLNKSGSTLTWGAYLGAAPSGVASAIAVDSTDDVYVAGSTASSTLAITS